MNFSKNHETFFEQIKQSGYSIIQTPSEDMVALVRQNVTIPIPVEKLNWIEKEVNSYLSFRLQELFQDHNK